MSNTALTKDAKTELSKYRAHMKAIVRYRGTAAGTADAPTRIRQNEEWAARAIVSATRSINKRNEEGWTKMSHALAVEIATARNEMVRYAMDNGADHMLEILQNNVYTACLELELYLAGRDAKAEETPSESAEAVSVEPGDRVRNQEGHFQEVDEVKTASAYVHLFFDRGDMSWRPSVIHRQTDLIEVQRAPIDETPSEDDAPKHWTYNDVLAAAEFHPEAKCRVATVTLREGDTAVAMGTTKYEHYGPGTIVYFVRADGTNSRTDCPVRPIRK